ncbi:MAG: hypothetical protein A2Y77_03700 [Planctomycetes bacterium RBG_13_62_9]|nr:MAG: hypothetical protein A2Y77_03700 [Planctomycetes bacterium RBG_13_62_9]
MNRQLRVVKTDGSTEAYLHTKVLGTINNALAAAGRPDVTLAERLAEVMTFHLYDTPDRRRIDSSEILAMIKAVLAATGNEDAAAALAEHALERRLKRTRTEVLAVDVQDFNDAENLSRAAPPARALWDKGRIVRDLKHSGLAHQTARTIAALAEERLLCLGLTAVPRSLVKQIVLGETASILHAQQQLQTT